MASRAGRLKERGKRRKHGSPEGEGGGERHAPAKPRLVAVLRSKLRFTRFLQVPTGSHFLSPPPLPFRLLAFLLSLSLYFLQVPKSSHCLSSYPLAFRLLNCPTFYYSTPHFSSLSRRTVRLAFLSSSPLAFRLLNCPTFYYSTPHFSSRSRCTVRLALAFSHFLYIIGILINHWR